MGELRGEEIEGRDVVCYNDNLRKPVSSRGSQFAISLHNFTLLSFSPITTSEFSIDFISLKKDAITVLNLRPNPQTLLPALELMTKCSQTEKCSAVDYNVFLQLD